MSRVFSDGFEMGIFGWKNTQSGIYMSTYSPRSGNYVLRYVSTSTASVWTTFRDDPNDTYYYVSDTEVYARTCFYVYSGTHYIDGFWIGFKSRLDGPVAWCYLRITVGSPLILRRPAGTMVTGTTNIATATWYRAEIHFKLHDTNGIAELKLDGYQEGSTYNGDTTTNYFVDDWARRINCIGVGGYNAVSMHWDDIAVNFPDGSGYNDGWPGDGKIVALTPNANGDSSEWVGSDGNSVDNYQLVDETPANSTDYVTAVVSGYKDQYNLTDWVDVGNMAVRYLWIEAYGQNQAADGLVTNLGIKTNSTEYWETTYLTPNWQIVKTSGWPISPYTVSEWTVTDMDALQAGVSVAE